MIDIKRLIEENRARRAVGLPCFCTANEHVLRAILRHCAATGAPTVIEATCNQVNQDGGYTGMTAPEFIAWIHGMAEAEGVPACQLVLGGDHLGPNPWRKASPAEAMTNARELVRQYAAAGFRKIHLDASMACGGEPPLSFAEIAERAADLCAVAEANAPDPEGLVYVIGTEVPIPGGETEDVDALDVTSVARFEDTIATHREAFDKHGLDAAWSRIAAIVTQPGVDFSHSSIYPFDPDAASHLRVAIEGEPGLGFEAHSTDYQPTDALRALVQNHFVFLKVGPELTFRFREAVYALADVEDVIQPPQPSNVKQIVAERMAANPDAWTDYYKGDEQKIELLKLFSYSDRIRYYWPDRKISRALEAMIANLRAEGLTPNIISRYFTAGDFGKISTDPIALMNEHINLCTQRYFEACGH